MNILLDDFCESGSNLNDYMKLAKRMDTITDIISMRLDDILVWSFIKKTAENKAKCVQISLHNRLKDEDAFQYTGSAVFCFDSTELLNELVRKEECMFEDLKSDKRFFISDTIYKTLSARQTGLGGSFLKTPCLERDIALSRVLSECFEEKVNAVVRTDGKNQKIFAMHKGRFERTSLEKLGNTASELITEYTECKWSVTHSNTRILLEKPDMSGPNDLIPGILLITSDTGYVSSKFMYTWRRKNGQPFIIEGGSFDTIPKTTECLELTRNRLSELKDNPELNASAKEVIGARKIKMVTSMLNQCPTKEDRFNLLFDLPGKEVLSESQAVRYRQVLIG